MRIALALACLAIACLPLTASADRYFTDRGAFLAEVVDPLTDSYNCGGCSFEPLGNGSASRNGVGYVNVGTQSGNIFVIGSFYRDINPVLLAHDFLQSENETLFLSLPGAARSLGFDAHSLFWNSIYTLTIETSNGSLIVPANERGFLGVTSDVPFTSARIDVRGFFGTDTFPGLVQIDNLTGSAALRAVPAPLTGWLMLGGLAAMLALRRRHVRLHP